ncbi:MAG: endonuclease/exonuclease/phosphatase family protein [Bacteroidota bacterium]
MHYITMVTKILSYKPLQITLSAFIILGALICIFTPNYFLFKMGASFAVHIMIGYLLLAMVFLFFRQPQLMFTSFACCAGLCLFLKHSSNAELALPPQTSDKVVKVAHFNMSASDEDYDQTIASILATNADLISVQEVTPDWHELLKTALQEQYPHSNAIVRFDPFGIAVYSKYPFQQIDTLFHEDIPSLVGTIQTEGEGSAVHFISAHTTPPLFSSAYNKMKAHLTMLGQYAQHIDLPIITLGDFHAPPWWGEIQELKEVAQLQDSRRSATYSFSDVFQNPVDYILYSTELTCIDFRAVLSNSNHLGIQGVYQFHSNPQYASKANR